MVCFIVNLLINTVFRIKIEGRLRRYCFVNADISLLLKYIKMHTIKISMIILLHNYLKYDHSIECL